MQKSSFDILRLFTYAVIHGESVYISVQAPWIPAYKEDKWEYHGPRYTDMDYKDRWHPEVQFHSYVKTDKYNMNNLL